MDLGARFGRLWQRLLGREHQPPTAPPPARRRNQRKRIARAPDGARAVDSIDPPKGGLQLTVEDPADKPEAGARHGAGFDPYSSDGGFARPRSWDDVSRK
jgi:hypothetical protein